MDTLTLISSITSSLGISVAAAWWLSKQLVTHRLAKGLEAYKISWQKELEEEKAKWQRSLEEAKARWQRDLEKKIFLITSTSGRSRFSGYVSYALAIFAMNM